ncbi:MAG: ShlB/FhaC/HecB family hemolysin secretion/activation protein, partial [Bdellovibrionales bacterium]|nr:ShlB/FhaC/HecB family hemolysin secretion/activation protein [Bdellovibrionales bacterium]
MLKNYLVLIIIILFSNLANARDIPTVDDINKTLPKLPVEQKMLPSEKLKLDQDQKLEKEDQILKILVKEFKFDGNIYYSNDELKEAIKEVINQELGYDQLIDVTRAISNYYRASGFLATAFLPPQDINEGIIKIKITEAMLGTIIFEIEDDKKLNLPKENIRQRLLYKIEDSGVLNIDQLDKNVRNLNKIPGINALAQLEEGKNFGETNIKVTAINTETIFGNTLVDNNGSRSSGYNKITNNINVDGLFNIGDRLAFTNVLSGDHHIKDNHEESNYYAVSSIMPVGYNGMLATLRVSKMEYKLSAPFDSTKPSGYSS